MSKFIFYIIICTFYSAHSLAQSDIKLTAADSAQLLLALSNMLDSTDKPTSYATVNIAVGNRLFSQRNNTVNAKQGDNITTVFTPSVSYFNKSGFNATMATYLLNDASKGFSAVQYSATVAYDLPENEHFSTGASYTRYFVKDKFSAYASPIQNDLYGYFSYKKYWLEPGVAVGYSTGQYKQLITKDTVINNRRRFLYDSITNNLKAFSVLLSVSHNFEWYQLLHKKDALFFTPSIMLNVGSSKTEIMHQSNATFLLNLLNKKGKLRRNQNTPFQVESIGLNVDVNYTIGKFNFQPQLYLDYYLPSTDTERFSQVFTFNVGYSF